MAAELPAAAKIHVTWPQEFNLNGNLDIVMAESTSWTQLTTPPYHFSLFQLGEHRRPYTPLPTLPLLPNLSLSPPAIFPP